jgi:hypothetical protein
MSEVLDAISEFALTKAPPFESALIAACLRSRRAWARTLVVGAFVFATHRDRALCIGTSLRWQWLINPQVWRRIPDIGQAAPPLWSARHVESETDRKKGLLELIERIRTRVSQAFRRPVEVISCYEAGYDGFWLHRLLEAHGVRNFVIDPASVQVDRRARRVKTDNIDVGRFCVH